MRMKNKKLGIRGSINIFVALMMVPTMAFTGLMVDFSRINMTEAQALNAARLAVNSMLAYYDGLLYDIFGLLATSQDQESLEAFAVSVAQTSLGTGSGDGNGFNILGAIENINIAVGPDSPIYTLNNMAYLQFQIMEYMRYRVLFSFFGEGGLDSEEDIPNLNTAEDNPEMEFGNGDEMEDVQYAVTRLQEAYRELLNAIEDAQDPGHWAWVESERDRIRDRIEFIDNRLQEIATEIAEFNDSVAEIADLRDQINDQRDIISNARAQLSLNPPEVLRASFERDIEEAERAMERLQRELDDKLRDFDADEYNRLVRERNALNTERAELLNTWQSVVDEYNARFDLVASRAAVVDQRRPSVVTAINSARAALTRGLNSGDYSQEFVDEMNNALDFILNSRAQDAPHYMVIPHNFGPAGQAFANQQNNKRCNDLNVKTPEVTDFNSELLNWLRLALSEDISGGADTVRGENAERADERDTLREQNEGENTENGRPNIWRLPNIQDAYQGPRVSQGLEMGPGDNIISRMLLTEYGVQMFSNFTTGRVVRNGERADETTLTNIPITNDNGLHFMFGAELEYLLWGYNSPSANHVATIAALTVPFAASNFLFTFRCSHLNRDLLALKKIPIAGIGLSWAARGLVTAIETARDISALLDGHRVPLLKRCGVNDGRVEWRTPAGLISVGIYFDTPTIWGTRENPLDGRGLYYYQYLRLLMLVRGPEGMTERLATLIEKNMNYHLAGGQFLPQTIPESPDRGFRLSRSRVAADVVIAGDMPYFFIGTPRLSPESENARSFNVVARGGY